MELKNLHYNDIYSRIHFQFYNCWMLFLPFFQDLNELWDWGVSFRWVGKEWPDKMMAWNYLRHSFPLCVVLFDVLHPATVSRVLCLLCVYLSSRGLFVFAQCSCELAQNHMAKPRCMARIMLPNALSAGRTITAVWRAYGVIGAL